MDNSPSAIKVDVPGPSSITQTEVISAPQDAAVGATEPPVLRLRLEKPKPSKKVAWRNGTIDNEHMNKKKSKCCCIYRKPLEFGESSSDSEEEECEHCFGHVENRKDREPLCHHEEPKDS